MEKISNNRKTNKIRILKLLGWLFVLCSALVILFSLTSYQVGPVKKMRGIMLLEYTGILKDKRNNAELIKSLNSTDEVKQLDAVLAMAHRDYFSENAKALLDYLKSDSASKRMKNIAVWALGELRAQEALELLYSIKSNENLEQYEVKKAINKIERRSSRPFGRK